MTPASDRSILDAVGAWYRDLQAYILGAPNLAPLHPLFPETPEAVDDFDRGQHLHERAIQVIEVNYASRLADMVVAAIDEFQTHGLGVPRAAGADGAGAIAATMAKLGHAGLPPLPATVAADMHAYFSSQPAHPGGTLEAAGLCSLDAARRRETMARYPTRTVLACPYIVEIACEAQAFAAVTRHLGCVPTILGYNAWWSFAHAGEARDAQLFHSDFGADYRFCKMFVYLTDVGMETGPHVYIDGTHDRDTVARARQRWPDGTDDFDEWYLRKHRKTDDETVDHFATEPAHLTGERGTRFLVNTHGVHKGLPPRDADRLVCEVLYGVSPRLQEVFAPLAEADVDDATRRLLATPPFDYANRLFVNSGLETG